MSRGQYTSAIDVWGAGCVFGELLQRVPWLGKAATPHLQVRGVTGRGLGARAEFLGARIIQGAKRCLHPRRPLSFKSC